jgi:Baseplate J-like protein.
MTHKPRTEEEIYRSLKSSLTGKIAKLTNFTRRSFNYIWTQAFADEVRKLEVLSTVTELAGWIDYTGGPVTEEDLDQLNIDGAVSADEINKFMQEDYLDEFIKIVGVNRLPGSRATSTVTFTTQSNQTDIPSGTTVTTVPNESGETINFVTTEPAQTSNGVTTVSDVPIQAVEVGENFNVPADTIIRLADPPIGVKVL